MKKAIKNALNNSLKGASSHEENSESSNSSEKYHPYKRTKPTCGRCRIHGTKGIILEGHKNYCKYRNCDCIKCHIFQQRRKLFATTIAMKRMDELDAKKKILPEEVPLSPLFFANKKCDLYILLDYSLKEMYKFASILSNSAIWDILIILKNYGEELDKGVKSDSLLENAKTCIFRVIEEDRKLFAWMKMQQAAGYYLSPPRVVTYERQPVGINSLHYPSQNLPVWPSYPLPILTSISSSPFPKNSLAPPTEPPTEPFTDSSTERSIDSSTDLSTESSTYYCSIADNQ